MTPAETRQQIRVRSVPACKACASAGATLYEDLSDRLFGVPGSWRIARCLDPACASLWLDPAPIDEDVPLLYGAYYTHDIGAAEHPRFVQTAFRIVKEGYVASRFGYSVRARWAKRLLALPLIAAPARREMLDASVMELRFREGGRVLDVGFGTGWLLRELDALGWDVEGVDFDPRAVATARRLGLTVKLGSLEDQDYSAESFDAITMKHVIEHLTDPSTSLRECRRLLRPGGMLALRTPNPWSLGHARFGSQWFALDPPRHLQLFSPPALELGLQRAGFEVVEMRSSPFHAAMIHAEGRRLAGEGHASAKDKGARRFRREERARLTTDTWAGEEIVATATPLPRSATGDATSSVP